jgi:hypothetical protein
MDTVKAKDYELISDSDETQVQPRPLRLTDLNDDVCSIISSFLSLSDCLHVLECSRGMRELREGLLRRRRTLRLSDELGSDGDAVGLLSLLTSSMSNDKNETFQLLDSLPIKNLDFSDRRDGSVSLFQGYRSRSQVVSRLRSGPERPHQQLWERKSDLPPLLVGSHQMIQAVLSLNKFCNLKELDLRGCNLSNIAFAQLLAAPLTLEILDLRGAISCKKIRSTPVFASTLKILRCGVLGRGWRLDDFKNLEEAYFDGSLKAREVEELSQLSKFSRLVLRKARVCEMRSMEGYKSLFNKLTELTFDECDIQPRSHLGQPPFAVLCDILDASINLQSLSLLETPDPSILRGPILNEDLLQEVFSRCSLPNLHSLCFCPAPKIGDTCIKLLISATKGRLKCLRIYPGKAASSFSLQQANDAFFFDDTFEAREICSITDISLENLAESCPLLEVLEIPHSSITDIGLQKLALSPCAKKIQVLNISRAPLFDRGTLDLISQRCVKLDTIMLRGCHVVCANGDALTQLVNKGVKVAYTPPVSYTKKPALFSSTSIFDKSPEVNVADDDVVISTLTEMNCPLCGVKVDQRFNLPRHFSEDCKEYLVQCTLCELAPPMKRSELQAHRLAHAERREDLAKRSRCPFFLEGCRFIELSITDKLHAVQVAKKLIESTMLDGENRDIEILRWKSRTLGIGEHLSEGHCTKAQYVCLSCGRDCGKSPKTTCSLRDCASIAKIRCRLQHKYPLGIDNSDDTDEYETTTDHKKNGKTFQDVIQFREFVEIKGEDDGSFSVPNPMHNLRLRHAAARQGERQQQEANRVSQGRVRHLPRAVTKFKSVLKLQTSKNGTKIWRRIQEEIENEDE